ncbi:MAG: hypothetical protein HY822_18080 [Acidobacteria bacterium]|nr:hypothetical protein [Acidobacteriota bacterium]
MAVDYGRDIFFRGDGADSRLLARFREAGASAVVFTAPEPAQEDACRKLGLEPVRASQLQFLSWKEAGRARAGSPVVLAEGLWPGVTRGGGGRRDEEVASASGQPWVDANGYWIGCLRAIAPARPAVLGYLPDEKAGVGKERVVSFDSLELALVDAWASGGNCLLAPETRYRAALAAGDEKAVAAWSQLTRTAAWLRQNVERLRQPVVPIVTALVAPGTESAELANLMFRHAVSPNLAWAAEPPPPAPGRILALVAASIGTPGAAARGRILSHAGEGATVVVDAPGQGAWWRVAGLKPAREEEDRDFYRLGKGQVVAYKNPIEDPSDFALDVIDLVTHKTRAVRLFRAPAMLPLLTRAGLVLINYGSGQRFETAVHVQGHFQRVRLERPEAAPADLTPARRGPLTEIRIPEMGRVALATLS